MAGNPKLHTEIVGPPRPAFKVEALQKSVGKMIASVEFGEENHHPDKHEGEAIILHFTDGTAMSVVIGSNAGNLTGQQVRKTSDFHTDIMVFWDD